MRARLFLVGLAGACFIGALGPACGGSGSGGADSGPGKDSTVPDTSKPDTSTPDTGSKDGGGACTGLDAAAAMIQYSPACGTCVEANCCSQAQACAGNAACIAIVKCQLDCIHDGGAPETCAMNCVYDGGSSGKTVAEAFDDCLIGSCPGMCVTK
jgi:hypothetical protein